MHHRFLTAAATSAALLIGTLSGAALAENVTMNASEIEYLLSGNTAEGDWDGTHYKSYFSPDGTAIYLPQSGEPQVGKWRVAADTGQYESFWQAVGWTGYTVLRTDAGFAWLRNGKIYPFTMIEGRKLDQ